MLLPNPIKALLAAALALSLFSAGISQPDLHFEHLTIEDGLANNEVRHIFQDSRGFMWFGTHSGLNVSEVGYAVGFTNPAYFSTAFLNEFGENPSAVKHS